MDCGALRDDGAVADSSTSLVQSRTEDSQEDDGCDNTLEGEEVLHLGVWNTKEWQLKNEVEHVANHACGGDALAFGDGVRDVLEAWPDCCKQHNHTLASSRGLYTEPYNSEDAAGENDELSKVVAEGHTSENREWSVELFLSVSLVASLDEYSQLHPFYR